MIMRDSTQKKILLLLFSGLEFGYSITPQRQWSVLSRLSRDWKKIEKEDLRKEIRNLYRSKAIDRKENSDGSYTIVLTEKGNVKALTYYLENIKNNINRNSWSGKWTVVIFDIPEKLRKGRDLLREKIKEIGFYELQKSVWVFPFDCQDEINYIIEYFDLRKYVRIIMASSIDNELHLKKIFKLI